MSNKEAVLEMARRAQAAGKSLDAFIRECVQRGKQHRPPVQVNLIPPREGAEIARRNYLEHARISKETPLMDVEASGDWFIAIAGQMLNDRTRTREALEDLLKALKKVYNASPRAVVIPLVRETALSWESLIVYLALLVLTVMSVFQITREMALEVISRHVAGAVLIGVVIIVATWTYGAVGNIVTTAGPIIATAWSATDNAVIPAVRWLITAGIRLSDVARVGMQTLGFAAERWGRILTAGWKSGGVASITILDVARVLKDDLRLTSRQIASALASQAQADAGAIAQALKDCGYGAGEVAQALKAAGMSAADIARQLKDKFGQDLLGCARTLKDAGFGRDQVIDAVAGLYGKARSVVESMLRAAGL